MIKKLICRIIGHNETRVRIVPHLIDLAGMRIFLGRVECKRCGEILAYLELGNSSPLIIDQSNVTLTPSTQVSIQVRSKILQRYRKEGKLK